MIEKDSYKGIIQIEKFDKDGNILSKQRIHNTVTDLGLDLFANEPSALYAGAAFKRGEKFVVHDLYTQSVNVALASTVNNIDNESGQHIVLLNLSDEELESLSNLGKEQSTLPITAPLTGINSKVVGYANTEVSYQSSDSRLGINTLPDNDLLNMRHVRVKAYEWGVDKAIGTFNTIAITTGFFVNDTVPAGARMFQRLDNANKFSTDLTGPITAFCPPGISPITDNDTILFTMNDVNYKHTISTFELEKVTDSDIFAVPADTNVNDIYVEDNYMYVLYKRSGSYTGYNYCAVYEISETGLSLVTTITTIGYSTSSYTYGTAGKFLKYNGRLFVFANAMGTTSDAYRFWELTKSGSNAYYSTATRIKTIAALNTALGVTLPDELTLDEDFMIGNYGDNFILYKREVPSSVYSSLCGIVFTDLADLKGTMTGEILPKLPRNSYVTPNIILSFADSYFKTLNTKQECTSGTSAVTNGNGTQTTHQYEGLLLSYPSWGGNTISYRVLDSTVEKTADQNIKINYAYETA